MTGILIIEDEVPIAEALKYALAREGYDVALAHDGAEGLERFEREGADLIILDLMLPGLDGIEVCRRVRARSSVPIVMLTAKDTDIDEILGLEMGADDYITKPFNMRAVVTRVKAVLRRAVPAQPAPAGERMEAGDIGMDLSTHEVRVRGREVHLTPTEYRLLQVLLARPGKVFTRNQLLSSAWGDFYGSDKTLDVHIRHLREKVEEDPADPAYVLTVRGTGYKLAAPGEDPDA